MGIDKDFWVLFATFAILFIHSLVPFLRKPGSPTKLSATFNSMTSGSALARFITFSLTFTFGYADTLNKQFYPHIPRDLFVFILFFIILLGFLFMMSIDVIALKSTDKREGRDNLLYYIKLFIIFLMNFSSCHYIPISASKNSKEILLYTVDCIMAYSLGDYSMHKTFPNRFLTPGRFIAFLGVAVGILSGYFAPKSPHEWFMAYIDSFLAGCVLMLIMKIEFTTDDSENNFTIFLSSALLMALFLGSYYVVNWSLLI